ncbi:1,4-dihydroxy-2-naphthoyl-CoA hydrolase [Hydrocoleum sp. CS-953]|uniref:acyl-CoA thioesterase n=1 Tax=Hydrocoleum sp. CS-953 TaxID=1671698 RepID=UPI000B9B5EB5|nr:acyl-CoA thioesterase [Hydrocoleum sp. CS-953]OZH54829.1 1,4-dihydroxy-2-naphthoyl-CoA hydrolase [Hydrocoleum sp. CS-953]
MSFYYTRILHFQDTDAAGVVYFANVLAICHEAYEASLAAFGINLKVFFSNPEIAIPIIHADVDFRSPMFCGDELTIELMPKSWGDDEFEIYYQVFLKEVGEKWVARANTKHLCIYPKSRSRQNLSDEMRRWLLSFESS